MNSNLTFFLTFDNVQHPTQRPKILQFTEPHTISLKNCAERYKQLKYAHFIHKDIVCTINDQWVGACNGDSGTILKHSRINYETRKI